MIISGKTTVYDRTTNAQQESAIADTAAKSVHSGIEPPATPIPKDKIWQDLATTPPLLRSWIGDDVSADRAYQGSGSGQVVEIKSAGRVMSFDALCSSFAPTQAGSGTPYPPGGAKNLCPSFASATINGASFAVAADGTVSVSGTASAETYHNCGVFALAAGTYSVSGAPAGSRAGFFDILVQDQQTFAFVGRAYDGSALATFTLSADAKLMLYLRVPAGAVSGTKVFRPQIEVGSAATAYVPYSNIRPISGRSQISLSVRDALNDPQQRDDYTAALGRTAYGGTFDWLSGELAVSRVIYTLTGAEQVELLSNSGRCNRFAIASDWPSMSEFGAITSSHFSGTKSDEWVYNAGDVDAYKNECVMLADNIRIVSPLADSTAFAEWLAEQNAAGTPVQVVIELAAPQTFNVIPQHVIPLDGDNYLVTDGDTISVDYTASGWRTINDTSSIEKRVSIVEQITTPSSIQSMVKETRIAIDAAGNEKTIEELGTYMTQTADGLEVKIEEMQIGGRNLLANSSFSDNYEGWTQEGSAFEVVSHDGYNCIHASGSQEATNILSQDMTDMANEDIVDQQYTLSAWIKLVNYAGGSIPYAGLYTYGRYDNSGTSTHLNVTKISGNVPRDGSVVDYNNAGWTYVTLTFTVDKRPLTMLRFQVLFRDCTGDLYVRNVKIERGNKATDWSPAHEDTTQAINGVNQAITDVVEDTNAMRDELNTKIDTRIRFRGSGSDRGLGIGDYDVDGNCSSEVLVKPSGIDMRVAGEVRSRFSSDNIRMSNMQIKLVTVDNSQGLALLVNNTAM